jgi:hypothetical protein
LVCALFDGFEDVTIYASDGWFGFVDQVNNVVLGFGCRTTLITEDLSVGDFDIVEGDGRAGV